MKSILDDLGIDETYTKEVKKPKVFTRTNDNIVHTADYNCMADLIEMPLTDKKNKYILVCVDIGTREFDIEPMKNKEPKTVLKSFKSMFKRPFIKEPKYTMCTDGGNEFKAEVEKWLYDRSIYHKVALKDRHSQQSIVENLNKQLERIFNGYMNKVEEQTKETYNNWDDIIGIVRTKLNKIRKTKEIDPVKENHPLFIGTNPPNFKVGDIVYRQSDVPLNALGHEHNVKKWRVGDYRYDKIPKKIIKVLYYSGKVPYRYMLKGVPQASYTEAQLVMAEDEKEEKYIIREIIGKKILNKKPQYLVWWRGYLKKDATWESGEKLIEDGHKDLIDSFKKK